MFKVSQCLGQGDGLVGKVFAAQDEDLVTDLHNPGKAVYGNTCL